MKAALHRHAPDAEHVVRGEYLDAVDIDLRGRVEAVEDQVYVGPRQQGRSGIEVQPVLPALIFDPLQPGFVVPEERVGNLLIGQQIKVNVARHGGRQPTALRFLRTSGNLPELPAAIQGQNRIPRGLALRLRVSHTGCYANCRSDKSKAGNSPSN